MAPRSQLELKNIAESAESMVSGKRGWLENPSKNGGVWWENHWKIIGKYGHIHEIKSINGGFLHWEFHWSKWEMFQQAMLDDTVLYLSLSWDTENNLLGDPRPWCRIVIAPRTQQNCGSWHLWQHYVPSGYLKFAVGHGPIIDEFWWFAYSYMVIFQFVTLNNQRLSGSGCVGKAYSERPFCIKRDNRNSHAKHCSHSRSSAFGPSPFSETGCNALEFFCTQNFSMAFCTRVFCTSFHHLSISKNKWPELGVWLPHVKVPRKTTTITGYLIFFCRALSIISTRGAPRFRLQCFRIDAKSCNRKVLMRLLSGVKGSGNL